MCESTHIKKSDESTNICSRSAVAPFIFILISSRRDDCTVPLRLAVTSHYILLHLKALTALTVCGGGMAWNLNTPTGSPRHHRRFDFLESQEDRSFQPSLSERSSLASTLFFIWGNNRMSEYLLFMQVHSFTLWLKDFIVRLQTCCGSTLTADTTVVWAVFIQRPTALLPLFFSFYFFRKLM